MAYDQSTRQLMQSAGYDNDKIGYDTNSGYVTYNGRNFIKPQKNYDGTTYTDQSSFDQAHNQYQKTYGSGTMFQSAEDSMPYDQRMAYYASNPTAAQAEYNRAQNVYKYDSSMGNTQNVNDASAHISKLQQILGINPNQSSQDQMVNQVISQLMNQMNTKSAYDPYSSAEYAAAKAQQEKMAQQSIRAGQEAMGASGMARSSDLANYAQNAQNSANSYLMTQVVPQLISNNQAQEQQKLNNLMSILSPLMQQQQLSDTRQQNQFNNAVTEAGLTGTYNGQDTMQKQANDLNLQSIIAQLTGTYNGNPTYQAQQDSIKNDQWQKTFEENVRQYGLDYARKQLQTNASIANAAADNARQERYTNAQIANMEADNARQDAASAVSSQKQTSKQAMDSIISKYVGYENDGKPYVKDPYNMRRSIIALGLSDDDTVKLLNKYNLPIEEPIYGGGR